MRLTLGRFTIRRMLALIALSAIMLAIGRWGYYRYANRGFAKNYYVGDIIFDSQRIGTDAGGGTLTVKAELAKEAALMKSSVTPRDWWFGFRSVEPFGPSIALSVVHSEEGHRQVAAWLRMRRELLAANHDVGKHATALEDSQPAER